jgi:hypothetical protein
VGVVAGAGDKVLTVEKDAAAAKAKGARGKALASGKLASDAALGRLTHGQVRLSDFKGSPAMIEERLARRSASYGLSSATAGALRSEHLQTPYRYEVVQKGGRQFSQHHSKKYERKLLRGGGGGLLRHRHTMGKRKKRVPVVAPLALALTSRVKLAGTRPTYTLPDQLLLKSNGTTGLPILTHSQKVSMFYVSKHKRQVAKATRQHVL